MVVLQYILGGIIMPMDGHGILGYVMNVEEAINDAGT